MVLPDIPDEGIPVAVLGLEGSLCAGPELTYYFRSRNNVQHALPLRVGSVEAPALLRFVLVPSESGFVSRMVTGIQPLRPGDPDVLRDFLDRVVAEATPHARRWLGLAKCDVDLGAAYAPRTAQEAEDAGYIAVNDAVSNAFFGAKAGVATFSLFVRGGRLDVSLAAFRHTHHVRKSIVPDSPWLLEAVE